MHRGNCSDEREWAGCMRVHLDHGSALQCERVHLDRQSALGSWECTGMHSVPLGCVRVQRKVHSSTDTKEPYLWLN